VDEESLTIVVTECCGSPLLTQLFVVVDSDPLTLTAYNGKEVTLGTLIISAEIIVEIVNGLEWIGWYWNKDTLAWFYLKYSYVSSSSASELFVPPEMRF